MEPAIAICGLTRRFDRKDAPPIIAVSNLNMTVQPGEVFGLLGPNGAGKTTTVRLLNGLLTPSEGSAQVLGLDIAHQGEAIRKQTGVLTETPSLYEPLTARENLAFFGELYGLPERELPRRIDALLDELGLLQRAEEPVGTFSKGMRQRLAIARALLHEPRVLFLDEPTSGLDPAATRIVHQTIRSLSHERRTIIMCTHNLAEAQSLCDRVAVLNRGVLQAMGTPSELAQSLWQGISVTIDLRDTPAAGPLAAVAAHPHVQKHTLEKGLLTLKVGNEDQIPDIVTAIASAGARIYAVQPQAHSLEDIYFKIQENNHQASQSRGKGHSHDA